MTMTDILLFLAANAIVVAVLVSHRRANARLAAQTAETARIEQIKHNGPKALVSVRQLEFSVQEGPLTEGETEHQLKQKKYRALIESVKQHVSHAGQVHAGFVGVIVALTIAWAFLFTLVRVLDVEMLEAIGYSGHDGLIAQAAGTIIALAFTLIGLIVAGLANVHPILPNSIKLGRTARLVIAVNLVALAVVGALWMRQVAVHRSEQVLGANVSNLQAQVDADRQTGASALDLKIAELNLSQAQQKLRAGESIDRLLAVVAPLLEMSVSWAPLYASELMVLLALRLALKRHRRGELDATGQKSDLTRRFTLDLTRDAIAAGFTPEEIEALLKPPDELPPPDSHETEPPTQTREISEVSGPGESTGPSEVTPVPGNDTVPGEINEIDNSSDPGGADSAAEPPAPPTGAGPDPRNTYPFTPAVPDPFKLA